MYRYHKLMPLLGWFKHRHDVHNVKDFPGKRGWVGVFCPARVEGKVSTRRISGAQVLCFFVLNF